jgi:hypothetical protein
MKTSKVFFERRSQNRFQVQKGAFAVLRPQFANLGQIKDINCEGLAFLYSPTGNRAKGSLELDIFLVGNVFLLERVPIKTTYDIKIFKRNHTNSLRMRRRGVQFGELSQSQLSQLEYFIHNYSMGKV